MRDHHQEPLLYALAGMPLHEGMLGVPQLQLPAIVGDDLGSSHVDKTASVVWGASFSTNASQMFDKWTIWFDILRKLSKRQFMPKALAVPFILRHPSQYSLMSTVPESSLSNKVNSMSASDAFKSKVVRQTFNLIHRCSAIPEAHLC